MSGAHRQLWRAGCCALVEAILSACNDELDEQLPLFTLLTPHHRIALLREVAVGILCERTPLPPETVWHYAAYFAPLHYAAFVAVPVECDMEAEYDGAGGGGEFSAHSARAMGDLPLRSLDTAVPMPGFREALEARADELLALGIQGTHEERAAKKKGKRERRAATEAGQGKATSANVRAVGDRFGADEVAEWAQAFKAMTSAKDKAPAQKQAQALLEREPQAFIWRSLLRAFCEELSKNRTATPAIVRRAITDALLPVTESGRDLWERLYCLVFGYILPWPGGEAKQPSWLGFLFGPLDRAYDAARDDVVRREAKQAGRAFAAQWAAARSVQDLRIVAVLAEAGVAAVVGSPGALEYAGARLADSDACRDRCAAGFELAQMPAAEVLALLPAAVDYSALPPGTLPSALPVHPEVVLAREHAWAWAHLWHRRMTASGSNYASLDARVDAVLQLASAEPAAGGSACPTQGSVKATAETALSSAPYDHAVNDVVRCSPGEWQTAKDKEGRFCGSCLKDEGGAGGVAKLSKCSACGVVFYCSKECQRRDWASHKRACALLKSMVGP